MRGWVSRTPITTWKILVPRFDIQGLFSPELQGLRSRLVAKTRDRIPTRRPLLCNFSVPLTFILCHLSSKKFYFFRDWKNVLRKRGVAFNQDFLPFLMSGFLRSNISQSEPLSVRQNMALVSLIVFHKYFLQYNIPTCTILCYIQC